MSKKTFFKRIALSTVASLGFGLLSLSPASATVTSHTLTIDSATDSITLGETATAVLTHSFVNLGYKGDTVTITGIVTSSNAGTAGTITLRVTDSYTNIANDATRANSPFYSSEASIGAAQVTATTEDSSTSIFASGNRDNASNRSDISISNFTASRSSGTTLGVDLYNPTAAGTYTISFFTNVSSDGAAFSGTNTPSVTWTVTVAEPTRAASSASSVTLRSGAAAQGGTYWSGTAEATDSASLAAATSSATDLTEEFSLIVKQKLGSGTNTARESYTVQVTGEAFVTAGTTDGGGAASATTTRPTTNSGGVKSVRMATYVADSATLVRIWSTGTAGTATVTVTTDGGVVLGTKTLTFHGTLAGLEKVAIYKNVIRSGVTTGSTSVIALKAVDSGGRGVTNPGTVAGVSSNTAAIASGSCTDNVTYAGVATDASTKDGTLWCDLTQAPGSVSGAAATITWRVLKYLSTTEYWTVDQAVTMGGAAYTLTITTDKATYEPGEAMTVKVTAKDASGNTPYDLQAGPSITVNKAIGGALSMSSYIGGVSTSNSIDDDGTILDANNLFAPAASGKFILTTIDASEVTRTATATVGDDAATAAASAATDAALEAIDAANAATDAANLAAEAADAATVAAEEARDAADAATAAVEALAKDIADLTAGIRAQITTLANTVAKIAKKVKA